MRPRQTAGGTRRAKGASLVHAMTAALLVLTAAGAPAAAIVIGSAADLCDPAANPCVVAGSFDVADGSTIDVGARELRVLSNGQLNAHSGQMTLRAGTLTINVGGFVGAPGGGSQFGGTVNVFAGQISVAGAIDASGSAGGDIRLTATAGSVTVSGPITSNGQLGGGSVTILASGDVTVSSSVDVGGGEGGDIVVEAGSSAAALGAAGNLTVTGAGRLIADATVVGSDGGSIAIKAGGNGSPGGTGHVSFSGLARADGVGADEESGDGGDISVSASGDIRNLVSTGGFMARGRGIEGAANDIGFEAIGGAVTLTATVEASAKVADGTGGSVDIKSAGPVQINGVIDVGGGGFDAGEVSIVSGAAVSLVGTLFAASTTGGGSGGFVNVTAGGPLLTGTIQADGSGSADFGGGFGGNVTLVGTTEVRVSGPVSANGGSGGGFGGVVVIEATRGAVAIEKPVRARGPGGPGGQVRIVSDIASMGAVTVADNADIDVSSTGSGSPGEGGTVTIEAGGDLTIAAKGSVVADAGARSTVGGARVDVIGCAVTIPGTLRSMGPGGTNRLQIRTRATISGRLLAETRNEIRYRSLAPNLTGATMNPGPILVADAGIAPCGVLPTSTPTVTSTPTITGTPTMTETPPPSSTPTITPTPTATPTRGPCTGDCDDDAVVRIDELVHAVGIALAVEGTGVCHLADLNHDGVVSVAELVRAMRNARQGCGP